MLPPGPPTPAFWQTLRFASAPREYSLELIARYGQVCRFRALNGRGVSVSDPEMARVVFAADPSGFDSLEVLKDLFGVSSVLATSGAVHKRQRKLLNPRFHGARMKELFAAMGRVITAHLSEFKKGAQTGAIVTMVDLAQSLTLDVIVETTFGASASLDRCAAREMLQGLIRGMSPLFVFAPLLRSPLFPMWRNFARRRAAFDRWVDALVAERRRPPAVRGDIAGSDSAPALGSDTTGSESAPSLGSDILGMLLAATYEDGSPMSDGEVRDQLMTLLIAGHETTAVALAWGVYWLLREPQVLARLRDEVDALGPDPAPEAVVRLPYLAAVISETLRIEPIVSDVARVCREPLELGPWQVPAGELALINISAILEDPKLFPEPRRFRPERFLERSYAAAEFMPFGGGHRRCLGAAFAEAELALALAAIASRWELALASSEPERAARRNITMGPKSGVRVRVARERCADAAGEHPAAHPGVTTSPPV